ncbi:MAG: potassium-transporting ATPase subunit KdpA [Rubrivivax sp.]|nr:MAG: potassium-transporting ATPase subunit KdpA [Rubrivivax sp.]
MSTSAWALLGAFFTVLLALAWPLGHYLTQVMEGRVRWAARLESPVYRLAGVRPEAEMGWLPYALALLVFNLLGVLVVYALQRLQGVLPWNPQGLPAVSPDSAFNTAISFVANTNWQGYAGEATLSYLTQMLALTVQNFLSAATGLAVAMALIRGFARHGAAGVGNAWADLTRATLWVLLPLSLVLALVFVGQGVVQSLAPYQEVATLQSGQPQVIALGPVASQEAIKMLGTNGGGFFNANSAHPFENPTALSNFMQMVAMFLIPTALCFVFGRVVGDVRQGWAVLATMALIFVAAVVALTHFEQAGNPRLTALGVDAALGNMEGKEVRFGIEASSLFAAITTAASCGAVNALHDSFTPLGGAVPLVLMQLGEVVFGGVGSGLYGMLVFAILAVFIAGLMIGRTPEYLGKKIEAFEMKMVALAILVTPMLVLLGTAAAVMVDAGRAGVANPGAHGFSEILYAFTSAGNNNGSAFAGLSANTPFYNIALGIAMWFGRFGVIVPVLAIAGSLAGKKRLAANAGTMPTHGPLFVVLLTGTVLLVGLLNYVPALALGPSVEHLVLNP